MRILLAFSFSLLFALSSYQAAANNKQPAEVTKKQAVVIAKKAEDGRTLKITEQEKIYTVRILKTNGHVVDVHVNKKTGEVKKD
ncbi:MULTISPECIES: PepSY domain-containing protein [Pseudoalteromonas]|jgi:uncharacterized membrane protein YkoI|uniref:PepSY domain-containing protein n=1 Tax=Pseudoalteromonas lipolytica TaxID=570156 RepID=A0AAD0WC23_9GAMM|nr:MULTISPECIES: PepSY domain-containing protein [Pseudoalteromonas]AXV65003.1 hypothetical protein D0907_06880 [Pseudoalteromonas donghaensis]MAE02117.1 hypothetical protein [Pseudoalteromonas sp.]MBE0351183.1 hypothetical protein [Pseudoalteromonas lipolytica LMEB 39]QLJ09506.1 PepSY domain-containing protein [Pseudoalteromonas sp. JSTW]QPL44094.1 PepSY domain-containing protein [Pseudoalteromonas sp. A41-2]|tara:strand:+ start:3242 stop:3493 length:252 start_codon:yes stop_codon:yes gene_type:complete